MNAFNRLCCTVFVMVFSIACFAQKGISLSGAWKTKTSDGVIVMICTEKFFSAAVYDLEEKTFSETWGGKYRIEENRFVEVHEFNTMKPESIGKEMRAAIGMKGDKLVFHDSDGDQEWTRIDDGTPGKLGGAWLITGRMNDGSMAAITPGARRTMKILSGTRFQWIAYNTETKEFFGTGGGTYTSVNGRYTETIEFFSRDNTRVGKELSFDFSLDSVGKWRHKGMSSKGEPIDEIWTKREHIGI